TRRSRPAPARPACAASAGWPAAGSCRTPRTSGCTRTAAPARPAAGIWNGARASGGTGTYPPGCSGATAYSCLPYLLGQAETDVLSGDDALGYLHPAEPAEGGDDLLDHRRRRGGPGGEPDRAGPGQPAQLDVFWAVDQVCGRAIPLRHLHQAARVRRVRRTGHQDQVAFARDGPHRELTVGAGVAD